MLERSRAFKARAIRKLLMATLCMVVATAWTVFQPTVVHADWCADDCESVCSSGNLSCAWVIHHEGSCTYGCA